jgi:hypothetical protein
MSMRIAKVTALALMAFAQSATAAAQPEAVFAMDMYLGRFPAVHATVAGKEDLYLFDTGGGVTVISPAGAKAAGCTVWGNVTGFRLNGERIDAPRCDRLHVTVAGSTFVSPTALVLDINNFLPKDSPPVAGSLALDLFAGKQVTLAFASRKLILESSESLAERVATAHEVPIRLVRDAQGLALTVDIGVPTSKGLAWMELDCGNVGPQMFVSTWVAPEFKLDPAGKEMQDMHGVVVPGVPLPDKARVLPNMIMDGNIGMRLLSKWNLTLDLKAGRAWLSPAE